MPREKFIIIKSIVDKFKLKNKIRYLCELSGVSRSGYYNYFSNQTTLNRSKQDLQDYEAYENILKAFNFKNRKKGAIK